MLTSALLLLLSQAPIEAKERVGAAYVQLLGSAVMGGFGVLLVSLGTQVRVTDALMLHADAALVWAPGTNPTQGEDFRAGTSVSFSLGPQFQLWGKGLKGLFLGPKVYGIYSDNNVRPPRSFIASGPRERWRTGEAGVGVDLAFQWHFGRFFLGSVVGVSVGYALTPIPANIDIWSTFGGANMWDVPGHGTGFVLGMNVHLLRVGFVW